MKQNNYSRRRFLKTSGIFSGAFLLPGLFNERCLAAEKATRVGIDAHLWVYASRVPPDWDCTPILEDVFRELKYAGYDKIELMESVLKHEGAVTRIKDLAHQHKLPVTGTSYYGDMWNKDQQQHILEDIEVVIQRLHAVGGNMIGLTVGDAKRKKTETELDTQAETLKRIIAICKQHRVQPNLHNHTFEVADNLHDLKGTLQRIPDIKLGPDLNWLVRGGVDPVWFIKTYGRQMVYMHIRDQRADGKWTEAVGEGVMDFPAIAKALQEVNYNGRAAVELAFDAPPVRPVKESWKLSRAYVRNVFGW
jgi:sugar phosphate isomerase/epimerase